jgi:hypothetical protein
MTWSGRNPMPIVLGQEAHPSPELRWRASAPRLSISRHAVDRRLLLDELITTRIRLDAINTGLDRLRRGDEIRGVVLFDRSAVDGFAREALDI